MTSDQFADALDAVDEFTINLQMEATPEAWANFALACAIHGLGIIPVNTIDNEERWMPPSYHSLICIVPVGQRFPLDRDYYYIVPAEFLPA